MLIKRVKQKVALSIILFGKEIISLFADDKFLKAVEILPVIIVGFVFFSIYEIYGRNSVYANKTFYASLTILIPGIINIFLNIIFIPRFGYMGSAYASLISYIIMAMLAYIISTRVIRLHSFPANKLIKPVLLFFLFYSIYYLLIYLNFNIIIDLIIKILLVIILGILLSKLKFEQATPKTHE